MAVAGHSQVRAESSQGMGHDALTKSEVKTELSIAQRAAKSRQDDGRHHAQRTLTISRSSLIPQQLDSIAGTGPEIGK